MRWFASGKFVNIHRRILKKNVKDDKKWAPVTYLCLWKRYRPDLIESYPYPHIADYFDSSQVNINAFFIRQSSLTAGSCEVTTLRYRPPARLEDDPLCFSKYTSCGVLKSPGNGSEITGKRRNKKTLQAPKKGLQRCFLASQKRFELPTPRLGDAPGTPFGLKNRGKKSLEIIDIKGFESFWTDN